MNTFTIEVKRRCRAEMGTLSLPTFALFCGWRRNPYGREIYTARHGQLEYDHRHH